MRKTSVYLTETTKAELHDLSRRWGRSEAELVRLAIDRLLRRAEGGPGPAGPGGHKQGPEAAGAGPPVVDRPAGPRLVAVGVGPSAPDLVTRRAVAVLEAADRVFAASTGPDAIGRAEAIVRSVAPGVAVDRLRFVIADDPTGRARATHGAAATMVAATDRGEVVAFVTLGDPSVYSTWPALARLIRAQRPELPVEVVPGVMAFQELAARTGTVLAEEGEHLHVVDRARPAPEATSPAGNPDVLDDALDRSADTVVVYKGGRHVPELAARLAARQRLDGAVIGELLGLPGGRCGPLADVADRPASYLATVVVPPARAAGAASPVAP